jgi:hypothetical protein
MNIDNPSDFRVDDIVDLHDLCHDPDHFIKIGIIKIKDDPLACPWFNWPCG